LNVVVLEFVLCSGSLLQRISCLDMGSYLALIDQAADYGELCAIGPRNVVDRTRVMDAGLTFGWPG
jgi:hypothetical protein